MAILLLIINCFRIVKGNPPHQLTMMRAIWINEPLWFGGHWCAAVACMHIAYGRKNDVPPNASVCVCKLLFLLDFIKCHTWRHFIEQHWIPSSFRLYICLSIYLVVASLFSVESFIRRVCVHVFNKTNHDSFTPKTFRAVPYCKS